MGVYKWNLNGIFDSQRGGMVVLSLINSSYDFSAVTNLSLLQPLKFRLLNGGINAYSSDKKGAIIGFLSSITLPTSNSNTSEPIRILLGKRPDSIEIEISTGWYEREIPNSNDLLLVFKLEYLDEKKAMNDYNNQKTMLM
jgi:hypothetical protein